MSILLFILAASSQPFTYVPDPGMATIHFGNGKVCPPRIRGFDCAAYAFNRGDLRSTVAELQVAADKGDPRAMKALGLMLRGGIGVPADRDLGEYWLRLAAEQR
ncbi:MAG: hypothetical protein M3Q19_13425 [Pseudomonadota bacterium]|nr:hypothetical protein [Pseudomonadota bacterium]